MNKEELISYLNNIDFENSNIVYNEIEKLVKENKKKYTFDHDYKKMWENLIDKTFDLQEEYRELKLQNLELRNIYFNVTHINKIYTKELNRYIAKHQKFIKYLEDEIKKHKESDIYQPLKRMALATLEHILQKYKKWEEKMKTNNSNDGMGFVGLLTIVFIVLKLTKVISWSWLWVLSPIWISLVIGLLLIIIYFIIVR